MGIDTSCCVDEDTSAPSYKKNNSTSETEPINKRPKQLEWTKQKKIKLKSCSSFGKPIIHGNNILFTSSRHNCIIIKPYNTNNKTYTAEQEIKCNDMAFDIQKCVYTFDSTNNLIYFINNNQQIMTVNMYTKKLIINQNVSTDNKKHAQIAQLKDKIYILGTEHSVYDDEKSDNFIFVPYDAKKLISQTQVKWEQKGFGKRSVCINVTLNKRNYIFIMGGENDQTSLISVIWILDTALINESSIVDNNENCKWSRRFLHYKMNSFGVVNYKNKYLITFGGLIENGGKQYWTNEICVLDFRNGKDKNGDDLRGKRYILQKKLELKCGYFAVYDDKSGVVHLFAWNGKSFTIEINDIMNEIENKWWHAKSIWTDQGKTALPTKSSSIRNVGPKIDDDDSDSD